MPVGTDPGHSTDTPISEPAARRSWCRVSLSPTTAAFAALYGALRG